MKAYLKTACWSLLALSAASGGAYWYYCSYMAEPPPVYKTATVQKADLVSTISATGTLEPEELVDVGAQVTGQILSFGRDVDGKPIDYGSFVKKGMVLTSIDDTLYSADAAQAEAAFKQAESSLERAKADLNQLKAKRLLAECDMDRAERMKPHNVISQADYDSFRSALGVAQANVEVGQAAISQAESSLLQAKAALGKARRNLDYCTIKSPVDGIVIDRRVNIGQTVVSSMSTSSLFLIAKDLKKMQLWVAVNEADVGKIYPGQPVSFTADAFPSESFEGKVGKLRLNASMSQNVVSYTVEVLTDNSSGRLLPYLTASVLFEVERLNGTIAAPNSALRWMPKQLSQVSPEFRGNFSGSDAKGSGGKQQGAQPQASAAPQEAKPKQEKALKNGIVWVKDGKFIKPVKVKVGATDGLCSAISGEGVVEGMEIITGQVSSQQPLEAVVNPFTPKLPGASRR